MAKLVKQYYYKKNGESKLNCFHIAIAKNIVYEAGIDENDEIKIYTENGKVIIEKVKGDEK